MKHFFFIDDSGSKNWETPYSKDFVHHPPERNKANLNFWRNNYFALSGIHISGETISKLNPLINEEKIRVFGSKHVEIKSEWFRNPHQRRKQYLEKFDITETELVTFMEKFWYPLIQENAENIKIQSFIIDKRYFGGKRESHTPMELLTQVLFDRLEWHPSENCIVVFDQMEGAIRSKKGSHGEILRVANREININSFCTQYTHSEVRFEKSSNSNFLQLADTVSYNVWRQFVEYGDKWEKREEKLPTYEFFEKLKNNFFCSDDGDIAGYGIIKHPDPSKIRWNKFE